jgi:hypothetical protein
VGTGGRPAGALLAGVAASAVALVVSGAPAEAAPRLARPPVDRVLVLSLPTLAWADLEAAPLPHLRTLVDSSSVASLSVRAARRTTTAGDAYATIGAGERATGLPGLDGLAFDPGEAHGGEPAADAFARTHGGPPGTGPFVLAAEPLRAHNRAGAYGARVGALGRSLAAAGVARAVVANADRAPGAVDGRSDEGLGREAALALAGPYGRVAGGSVGTGLLEPHAGSAFGRRLSHDAVVDTFRQAWQPRSAVLVEGSDLARIDAERPLLSPARHAEVRRAALTRVDALVARLLEHVDPERDAVVLLAPYHRSGPPHLTVFALRRPGGRPGLLDSPTTRRAGYVSLVDVGPTLLELLGVEVPAGMSGGAVSEAARGGPPAARRSDMVEADQAARFRDRMLTPVTVVAVGLVAAVLLLCALALGGLRPPWWAVGGGGSVVLAFLPMTYLAGALPIERWGPAAYWGFVLAGSSVAAGGAAALGRRRPDVAVMVLLAGTAGLLVVDALAGARLQLSTVFGYSPVQGGRFAGLPNVAFAQLAAATLLLVGLIAGRIGGRRGAVVGGSVLVAVVVVDGMPMWGADVGGVLSLVPTTGIVVAVLLGVRVRARAVAMWIGAGFVAAVAIGLLDLARPSASRTHLGRLLASVQAEGGSALTTVVMRKLEVNLAAMTNTPWLAMVPVVALFALWVARHAPQVARELWARGPELRAALAGLGVVAVLGSALNDSGIAVPAAMAVVASGAFTLLAVTDLDERSATVRSPEG